MDKLIVVLLDACQYEAATRNLGTLEHLTDYGRCAKYKVRGELPSLSKSMYATLFTGLPAFEHGVLCNEIDKFVVQPSVFSLCRENGGITAAASYYWMAELFGSGNKEADRQRFQIDSDGGIRYGIYYSDDDYPDRYVIEDGEYLRKTFSPNLLLYHTMAIDKEGHIHGAGSREYESAVSNVGWLIARILPAWLDDGYQVVITADHGMNEFGIHGGTGEAQQDTPLYILSPKTENGRFEDRYISEINIAPLLCRLLGIPMESSMNDAHEIHFNLEQDQS